jgi:hypothetical protein
MVTMVMTNLGLVNMPAIIGYVLAGAEIVIIAMKIAAYIFRLIAQLFPEGSKGREICTKISNFLNLASARVHNEIDAIKKEKDKEVKDDDSTD